MDLSQLEFHDATLLSVSLDPVERTVEIRLAYYPSSQSRERVLGILCFGGVARFNQIADLDSLQQHAGPGNVSQFVTGEQPGVSHLYLVRGLIEIAATSVVFLDVPENSQKPALALDVA
ncbi:hypothetical protein [Xanthomonas sacchari]|uniref:hypothetical protein n=1 Tax=Xanthomonas sacchari TaxID=56458 RepID=UPI00225AE69A|nr:hypothetical protein [Xanthomonas sacchari]UYK76887.1 hypothetical protein NG825_00285 [Xanthomonas sacchari]UYK80807.1 hypothetical protein NG829_00295 [Xanthomonas sacchari]